MKTNTLLHIALIVCATALLSCQHSEKTQLKVINESNDTLFCYWTTNQNTTYQGKNPLMAGLSEIVTDTSLAQNWNSILFPHEEQLCPQTDWTSLLSKNKKDKLYLHFFNVHDFYNKGVSISQPIVCDTSIVCTLSDLNNPDIELRLKK